MLFYPLTGLSIEFFNSIQFSFVSRLKDETRWSKSFYYYICAGRNSKEKRQIEIFIFISVCAAAMNNETRSTSLVKEGFKLLQKRTNPIELFVQKRVKI